MNVKYAKTDQPLPGMCNHRQGLWLCILLPHPATEHHYYVKAAE